MLFIMNVFPLISGVMLFNTVSHNITYGQHVQHLNLGHLLCLLKYCIALFVRFLP